MTTPAQNLHTLTCPTCGAPLEIKVDEPTIHCQYCNAIIENPEYHPPQPSEPQVVFPVEQPSYERPVYSPAPPRRRTSIWGILVGIIIFGAIAVGGVVAVAAIFGGSALKSVISTPLFPLQIHNPAILLSSDTSATPNLIADTYDTTADSYALSRLDITTHKTLWSVLGQKDYLSIDGLQAGDTMVYVVIGTRLIALQLSDGKQAWEESLPDKLPGACSECISVQKGQVVVLTTDSSLGGYDALTGHQTWEKQLDSAQGKLFPTSKGVGVMYSTKRGAALGIFDPTSGTEVTHLEPTCQPAGDTSGMVDQMEPYSNVVFDNNAESPKVYLLYGLFNACVQRWDLTSDTLEWQYVETDQNLDNSNTIPALLANGELYYTQGDQLRALDSDTGTKTQTLEKTSDYDLAPLLVSGNRLVVQAKRTKGSTRYELWGYDLTSGKNLWKSPQVNSSPIDPPDRMSGLIDKDTMGYTYQNTADGFWLITFQAQPNQVNLVKLNLDTGELSGQQTLDLGLDSTSTFYEIPTRITSSDSLSWFVVESRIYVVNPATGKFEYRWP